jgi:quinol monooxygenase YgiN
MAILLKIRWSIRPDRAEEFRRSQQTLCGVMSADHPGVIAYHVDYPSPLVSEWTEIYASDAVFKAHLENRAGQAPLSRLIEACEHIECRCWGDPNEESRRLLTDFKPSYQDTAPGAYVLHPRADRASPL